MLSSADSAATNLVLVRRPSPRAPRPPRPPSPRPPWPPRPRPGMKLALAADVEVLEASGMTVRGRPALRPGQSLIMWLKHWQWLHRAWESGRQFAKAETLLGLLEGLRFLRVSAHDSLSELFAAESSEEMATLLDVL